MSSKKSSNVDLESKKSLLFSMGLVIAFSVTLMGLELQQTIEEENIEIVQEVVVQEEMMPVTAPQQETPPPPPPPPPVLTTQIVVVDDLEEIEDELDFNSEVDATDEVNFSDLTSDIPAEAEDVDKVWIKAEKMPQYRNGGDAGLLRDLAKNTRYPMIAQENGIQGVVYVGFVIDRDGSITDVKILRGVDPSLDKEAIRVVKALPNWIPGEQAGKPVRVSFRLPVTFRLHTR